MPGVDIFPAGGRTVALAEAQKLLTWAFPKFACVVDIDFDDAVGTAGLGGRVYPYENADLEAMLVSLGALDSLLGHLGSKPKLSKCGGVAALRDRLLEIAAPIGRLRKANSRHSWGIAFDEVDLADKIDKKTLSLNLAGYCRALSGTVYGSPSVETLLSEANGPALEIFRGRDVIVAAGVALRKIAGTHALAAVAEPILSANLRHGGSRYIAESRWMDGLKALLAS
jgi:hypothetical protein